MATTFEEASGIPAGDYEEGFTGRVALITAIVGIALAPVMVWATFAGMGRPGIAVAFMSMVLFGQLMRMVGRPLKVQELATIRWSTSIAIVQLAFATDIIYSAWFRVSPTTKAFGLSGAIPDWVAPPPSSGALIARSLFHPDFWATDQYAIGPIVLGLINLSMALLSTFALSLIVRQMFIVEEELPWPTGQIAGQLAISMSEERDPARFRYFALVALGSAVYTAFQLWAMGLSPVIDLTPMVGDRLPGATLTLYPSLFEFAIGLILGPQYLLGYMVSSVASSLVLNPILVSRGVVTWYPGMGWAQLFRHATLDFWISPNLGWAIAIAIPLLIKAGKLIPRALERMRLRGVGSVLSPKVLVGMMLIGFAWVVARTAWLAPDYPLWLALAAIGYSVFITLVSGYTVGQAMVGVSVPYLTEVLRTSFYDGVAGWFAAPGFSDELAPRLTAVDLGIGFKAAEMTKTKPTSILKGHLFGSIVAIVAGLASAGLLWRLFGVPSSALPAPTWIPTATLTNIFIAKRAELIVRPTIVVPAMAIGLLFSFWPGRYLFAIGLYSGLGMLPLNVLTYAAALLCRRLLEKRRGKEWTSTHLVDIASGVFTGVAVIQILYVAGVFLSRLFWPHRY